MQIDHWRRLRGRRLLLLLLLLFILAAAVCCERFTVRPLLL